MDTLDIVAHSKEIDATMTLNDWSALAPAMLSKYDMGERVCTQRALRARELGHACKNAECVGTAAEAGRLAAQAA